MKKDQYLNNRAKNINQSVQTDLSFSPFNDVSFVINKEKDKTCDKYVIPECFEERNGKEGDIKTKKNIKASDDCNTFPFDLISQSKNSFIQESENFGEILLKCQNKVIDTDTEFIESSVDDFLLPRKINSSPLLFSQENKENAEMGDPSEEYSDPDDFVGATPPKKMQSTCNLQKEEKSNSVQGVQVKNANCKNQYKNCEFKESLLIKRDVEPMEVDEKSISEYLDKNESNMNFETTCKNIIINTQNLKSKELEITEEPLITQKCQKIDKHNLKIVISSLEGDENQHLDEFIELYNPVIDSDVNQQTDFLIVGVDEEKKVLKRTPKFLKAISLHVCIVNTDFLKQCCEQKDIVNIEKKFMPLDSSGNFFLITFFIFKK